jgi:hypothetical protein
MDLQLKVDEGTVQHEAFPGLLPRKRPHPPSSFTMTPATGAFKIFPTPRLFHRSARLLSKTAANPPQFHSLGPWQAPKIRIVK